MQCLHAWLRQVDAKTILRSDQITEVYWVAHVSNTAVCDCISLLSLTVCGSAAAWLQSSCTQQCSAPVTPSGSRGVTEVRTWPWFLLQCSTMMAEYCTARSVMAFIVAGRRHLVAGMVCGHVVAQACIVSERPAARQRQYV
jgi:hypothetical protein